MENNTKMKILDEALAFFAENGYKGTNLRDLAASLNITKSALYRHFDSKEAIWNAVLDRMEAYYIEHFGSSEKLPMVPRSCNELIEMSMHMLDFTMHDQKVILSRKLLITEQFRDERARKLAALHFLTGTKEMYTKLFAQMMENGLLKKTDPELLAFAYTSPITVLVQQCDREPEKEPMIRRQIEAFFHHFVSVYGKE
ncbi:MAG: TetR/AcrR family transcriptional regulator [Clostridia bacterium]|nr:TetR/AcrR family transcriptional regulator [Clostridia bacterium]